MNMEPNEIANEIETTISHTTVENIYIMSTVNYNELHQQWQRIQRKRNIHSLITPRQIEFERFTTLNHCYECTHNKSRCPNKHTKYCSTTQNETTHTNDVSNAEGNIVLSPIYADRQKSSKKQKKEKTVRATAKENKTYSAVAKVAVNQTISTTKET